MKNLFTFLFALAFLGLSAGAANAQTTWNIGTPNAADVTATLDLDSTLTISGTGAMQDFNSLTFAPWYNVKNSITALVLKSGITNIGNYAFYLHSSLKGNLTIPNSVTKIGAGSFNYCSGFTGNLTIPDSVTTIGAGSFSDCSGFTGLTIPNSVTTIGKEAFLNCSGLTSITCYNPDPTKITLGTTVFQGVNTSACTLNVPIGSKTAYAAAPQWKDFLNIEETVPAVWQIGTPNAADVTATLDLDSTMTISGTGAMQDFTIGAAPWDSVRNSITALVIQDGVTNIGNYAFYECINITGVLTIPASVTSIGNYAFFLCGGLTGNLTIPNSVTSIGVDAFAFCDGFTGNLTIPNSVTSIGYYAFRSCSGFTGNLTIGNSVTYIGGGAFESCTGFTGNLTIPNSVTTIGDYAFYNCIGLTDLTIPNSVTSIGDIAFKNCSGLTSVTCQNPDPTKITLGTTVFQGVNTSACTLNVPIGSKTAYAAAPQWKDFLNIEETVPAVWQIGMPNAADVTATLDLDSTMTISGTGAMQDFASYAPWYSVKSTITALVIQSGVTNIGDDAFSGCSGLTGNLTIPNSVTSIGNSAFFRCGGLTGNLTIPNSVTSINDYAFSACSGFTGNLTIPNSVTTIGAGSFSDCSGFTGLTIPNSVTTIGKEAFLNCSGLISITCYNPDPTKITLGTTVFVGVKTPTCKLNVPFFCKPLYEAAAQWKDFLNIEETVPAVWQIGTPNAEDVTATLDLDSTLTISGTGAMQDFTIGAAPWYSVRNSITALVIQSGVTNIGDDAFSGCSGLTGNLTIPNSVTSIGNSAFFRCGGLTGNLTIPNSVTSINDYAFSACSGFTGNLTIPNSVTTIGTAAFSGCTGFTGTLTIPNSVTSINFGAFSDCSGLTTLNYNTTNYTSIRSDAFLHCTNLTALNIGNNVQTIPDNAFASCANLTAVTNNRAAPQVINANVFNATTYANATLYVPAASYTAYLLAAGWQNFNHIQQIGVTPTITTASLPGGMVGAAYAQTLQATGDTPITWSFSGNLPNGLSLDGTTGVISGTPTASGTFNFTVTATNGAGSGSKALSVVIDNAAPVLTYSIFASTPGSFGSLQTPYAQPSAQTITVTNTGTGSVTLNQPVAAYYLVGTLSTTTLAAGANATFTIQPKANLPVGNYDETITVSGSAGVSAAVSVSFAVLSSTPDTYNITASTLVSFGSLQAPYTQPAAQTITITNTGSGTVTLNQPAAAYYLIGTLSRTTLSSGAKATFTIQPKANMVAGNYDETITVSGSAGVSVTISASFTVKVATGIDNVNQATGLKAWIENGTLHVSGLTAGKPWSVYNVTGILIYRGVATGDEATQLLTSRGVYIVQSETGTVKTAY